MTQGLDDSAAAQRQFEQLQSDPDYLRLLKVMERIVAMEIPKYALLNGKWTRVENEAVTKRLADLKAMLDAYVAHTYPLLKSYKP